MRFEKFYKEAFIRTCDNGTIIEYKTTDEQGNKVDNVYVVVNAWWRRLFGVNNRFQAGDRSRKPVAFSLDSPQPYFKHLDDKNLKYGVVQTIFPRRLFATVRSGKDRVCVYCSDGNREPAEGADAIVLRPGQQILFDYLKNCYINDDGFTWFTERVAYRIETMYSEQFPHEPLPLEHHIGFVPAEFVPTEANIPINHKRSFIVSFSEETLRPTDDNNKIDRQNWMIPGVFVYYERERYANGTSAMIDFKCIGLLYKRSFENYKMVFKDVPCVYRKFEGDKPKQTMWNDYLGLVECKRLDFENLEEELEELDIIYLDVSYSISESIIGMNPRKVDKLVEHSLREHCSHSLETDDFEPKRILKESAGKTLLGNTIFFKHFVPENELAGLNFLRITYYPHGGENVRFITTLDPNDNIHPTISMSGRPRNPNVEHEVQPTTEEEKDEKESFGYISKFSYNLKLPFEITFLDGIRREYEIESRRDFMNYGVFVKITKEEIENRGYLFPITSRRDERSIAVPAFAYVKPIDGNNEKYGRETIFGNIRIRPDETAAGIRAYNAIEHNSKILLKNIRFENEEWVAECDSIY